jgi:hypothetical protein
MSEIDSGGDEDHWMGALASITRSGDLWKMDRS